MIRQTKMLFLVKTALIIGLIDPQTHRELLHELTWFLIQVSNTNQPDVIHELVHFGIIQMTSEVMMRSGITQQTFSSQSYEDNILLLWANILGDHCFVGEGNLNPEEFLDEDSMIEVQTPKKNTTSVCLLVLQGTCLL